MPRKKAKEAVGEHAVRKVAEVPMTGAEDLLTFKEFCKYNPSASFVAERFKGYCDAQRIGGKMTRENWFIQFSQFLGQIGAGLPRGRKGGGQ